MTAWSNKPHLSILKNVNKPTIPINRPSSQERGLPTKRGKARETILQQATILVKERGAEAVSIDAVAKAAGSAKGLVHYYFKTRRGLMGAVASEIAENRTRDWVSAFDAPSPRDAVDRTWKLLTDESVSGVTRAWSSLVCSTDVLPDQMANKLSIEFANSLCDAFATLLKDKLALTTTVPKEEIGHLLAALVNGVGSQLLSGVEKSQLEAAYAVAWLGVLSLTEPMASDDGAGA